MATKAVERAVLDTNVLLAATDEGRPDHGQALEVLNGWPAAGTALYSSGQIMREYLSVATRPVALNGLGQARADAIANARALRVGLRLLPETDKVADRLLRLLEDVECSGRQVHDANVVATMLVHGVDTLVTANRADFARFAHLITVLAVTSAR